MRTHTSRSLAAACVLAVMFGGCAGDNATVATAFPGAVHEVQLGSGSLWLVNEEATTGDDVEQPRPHSLYIEDRATGTRTLILEYNRHIVVLPSPSGEAVAVTEYGASNESTCLVFVLGNEIERTDVRDRITTPSLVKLLPPANCHDYIEAVRWESDDKLRFRLTGYGDANLDGFDVQAVYRLTDRSVSAIDR